MRICSYSQEISQDVNNGQNPSSLYMDIFDKFKYITEDCKFERAEMRLNQEEWTR